MTIPHRYLHRMSLTAISLLLGISTVQASESTFSQRIIDGQRVPISTYPSTVALLGAQNFTVFDRQFCAGTVVAPRWIMTAAHCVHTVDNTVTPADQILVLEGATELRDTNAGMEHVVVNVIPHPSYVSQTIPDYNNDIALLEVATDLTSPPASLFTGDADRLVGDFAFIVGWGAVEIDENDRRLFPIDLRAAAVPFVSRSACNAPESYRGLIQPTMFCAGFIEEGGADTCQADSGGPLYANINGALEQVGVTSFGNGCGDPNFPGVYTHVPSFLPWLATFVGEDVQIADNGQSTPPEDDPGSTGLSGGSAGGGATYAFLWLFGFVFLRRR